jgi:hypothetical protein
MAAVIGLKRTQISHIENGRRPLKFRESILLKQHYGLSMEALIGGGSQVGTDAMSRLQTLPEEVQQKAYQLFYEGINLLLAASEQHSEEEQA